MSTWKQVALIGLIGLALAFCVNTLRGATKLPLKPAPQVTAKAGGADTLATATAKLAVIGFAEADALHRKELAIFVDARDVEDFDKGHIPGSICLPVDQFRAGKQKLMAPKGSLVVVYCSGGDCESSNDLAGLLVKGGFKKVRVYKGGFDEWEALGQPVEK
jgi:rhodanese-related sulfurtransferase